MLKRLGFVAITLILIGCRSENRDLERHTQAMLQIAADRWDGGEDFSPRASDAFGRPLTFDLREEAGERILVLRSSGPDGKPNTDDDLLLVRSAAIPQIAAIAEDPLMVE